MKEQAHLKGLSSVTRRAFLGIAGTAAIGAGFASGAKAAAAPSGPRDILAEALRYRKIDCHSHAGAEGISAADVVESCDRVGIEWSAISIPRGETPDAFRESNNKILAAIKEFPGRFIGQCFVNPHYPREALEELRRCLDLGFVGLGELYTQAKINDPLYFPLIEESIRHNAPVLMHARADTGLLRPHLPTEAPRTTSVADDFVDLARRYPEAVLIHAHIGGGGDWEYMCKKLRASPSIYIDTSGSVTDEGMIDFAKEQLGVDRMLFATDCNFETGVGKILASTLNEQERRQVFRDNFRGLLRKRGIDAD